MDLSGELLGGLNQFERREFDEQLGCVSERGVPLVEKEGLGACQVPKIEKMVAGA